MTSKKQIKTQLCSILDSIIIELNLSIQGKGKEELYKKKTFKIMIQTKKPSNREIDRDGH
jgi:hypothetical protein